MSDKKLAVASTTDPNLIAYYNADVVTANDMYSGGMIMPGRDFTTTGKRSRHSINGQERSDELNDNLTTARYWEYDSRIVRRWNVDPVEKAEESTYLCFNGNPILNSDVNGDDADGPGDPPWWELLKFLFQGDVDNMTSGVNNMGEGAEKQVIGPWNAYKIYNTENPDLTIASRKADGYIQGITGVVQLSEGFQSMGAKGEAIVAAPAIIRTGVQLFKNSGMSLRPLLKPLAEAEVNEFKALTDFIHKPIPVKPKITGYTKHGLNQAIGRDGGKGVNMRAMLDALENPKAVKPGSSAGTTAYKGKKATVVLNDDGKVVTTMSHGKGNTRGPRQRTYHSPNRNSGSGSAQKKANTLGVSYNPKAIR